MINHHFIAVGAPAEDAFEQAVLWGEAPWWPEVSPMRYTRLTGGSEIKPGCRYRQKVLKPFGPNWDVEIASVTKGREISFRFVDGMFRGTYRVYAIPGAAGCEIHFLMDYEVVGALNRLTWRLFGFRQHEESIKDILGALKAHIEGKPFKSEESSTVEDEERRQFLLSAFRRKQ